MTAELLHRVEDGVGFVVLNRPTKLNALGRPLLQSLRDVLERLSRDDTVRVMVFTGEGRAFCAGADIADMGVIDGRDQYSAYVRLVQELILWIAGSDKPTVAALNGDAFGAGLEMALACDLRVIVPGAKIAFPEARVGLIPAAGGSHVLANQVPDAIARRMLLLGEPLSSRDALHLGLVNEIVEPNQLMPTVHRLATELAQAAPLALRAIKQLMRAAPTSPFTTALDSERELSSDLFETTDARNGIKAFIDKTPPSFSGR